MLVRLREAGVDGLAGGVGVGDAGEAQSAGDGLDGGPVAVDQQE